MRLTKEREAELKQWARSIESDMANGPISELFSEIDALRVESENRIKDLIFSRHEFHRVSAENENLQARVEKLRDALQILKAGLSYEGVNATPGTVFCMKALAQDDACIDSRSETIHSGKDVSAEASTKRK